jgi:Leucine rich repeat
LTSELSIGDRKMPVKPSSKSSWYRTRVSVRALMILVLLVGGGFGWTVHIVRAARIQSAAVAAVEAAGGYVFYDCERDPNRIVTLPRPTRKRLSRALKPAGLRRPLWFGVAYFNNVVEIVLPGVLSDDELDLVGRFPRVEKVWHAGSHHWLTDAGLAHLHGLPSLKELDLSWSGVTDAGLVHLRGMNSLEQLNLSRTRITDAGLVHLRGLTSLQALSLRGTDVGNAGVVHLERLTNLRSLDLQGTDVDEFAAQELRRALPYASVLFKPIWEM